MLGTVLTLLFGTRPCAIKVGPIAAELRNLGVPFKVICSGQHTDLLSGTPADTDLQPDLQLGLPSNGDPEQWVNAAWQPLSDAFQELDTRWVVIQGDTQTAGLGAEVAAANNLPIVHVEAGVRSGWLDDPYPEEGIRTRISQLTSLHCAATPNAKSNLWREGIRGSQVVVTGNPVVSALSLYSDARPMSVPQPRILITLHRRETITTEGFPYLVEQLGVLAERYPRFTFLWPVHPHTKQKLPALRFPDNLQLVPPQSYLAFTRLLASSWGTLTDSGGVTEEACTLGVPTAILRYHHDRPEAVDAGLAWRFDPDRPGITRAINWLAVGLAHRTPNPVFGTPDSASRIAHLLATLD